MYSSYRILTGQQANYPGYYLLKLLKSFRPIIHAIILTLSLVFITIRPLCANAPDSLYFEANQKYQESQYEDAIELYKSVISGGYESAVLYYNLGNACFRSNKLGFSRLYYEKALKLDPRNGDIQANLNYVTELLVDKFEDVPELFLKRWLRSLIRSGNSDDWGLISMMTFILAFAAFSMYLLLRQISLRKAGFYFGISFLVVALITFLFSWKLRNYEINPESAIVIEYLVNVKSAPSETGTDLFVLHEGAKVWLEDTTSGWREIRLSDGRKGWLPATSIHEI